VLATQNPIEQEGTYPLPEAQLDRFMFMVMVNYPKRDEELEVLKRTTGGTPGKVKQVIMTSSACVLAAIFSMRALTSAGSFCIARACAGSSFARAPRSAITPSSDSIWPASSPVAAR